MEPKELLTLLLFVVLLMSHQTSYCAYTPLDNYLIACGSYKNIPFAGRNFIPESQHTSLRLKTKYTSVVNFSSIAIPPIYQSARIFRSLASYEFDIKQKGWHWIRLYFCPLVLISNGQTLTSTSITVLAENFVLLNNFSFEVSDTSYMFKEYALHVNANTLTLTFVPSKDSIAFINAIELVSIPSGVFSNHEHPTSPYFTSNIALETMYRLDMGGSSVTTQNDTLNRMWEQDQKYLQANILALNVSVDTATIKASSDVTTEIAPKQVYATAKALKSSSVSNLTWIFAANRNYKYIIRLHFCDIISKSKQTVYFNVNINANVVAKNLHLLSIPYFKDFLSNPSKDLDMMTVSIEPSDIGTKHGSIIMNGLEIMKVSNKARSLDGLSSVEDILPKAASKIRKIGIALGSVVGISFLLVLIVSLCCYLVARRSKGTSQKIQNASSDGEWSSESSGACRIFTFQEVQEATNNFQKEFLIATGGFGKVYKGKLEDGTKVAVKRASPQSKQGVAEFQNEIHLLSRLHHPHLVSLTGYCHEGVEMVLVYEYMANGSLSRCLCGPSMVPLSWKQRLEICIGAARGLHHLHTSAVQTIIHRDVKTENILLDENYVAKVADFGISKKGPLFGKSPVITNVKGTFGYIDPEYFRSCHLTEKSDVYSFGVVLIEVICGRPALDFGLPTEKINLASWALSSEANGELHKMIDPNLIGKVRFTSIRKVWEVAKKCLAEHRNKRPLMAYVLRCLEDSLKVELRNIDDGGEHISSNPKFTIARCC